MSDVDYRKFLLHARLALDSLEGGIGLSAKEREVGGMRRKIMDMVQSILPGAITMRENKDYGGPYIEACVAVVPGDKYRSLLNRLQEIEQSNNRLREELREIRQAEDATSDLIEALEEVIRVLDSNDPAIVDTVWTTDKMGGETLYDHCRSALAKARGEE